MRSALFLVCAFAFVFASASDEGLNLKRSAVPPNPNDVTSMTCSGEPCATPPYVFNSKGGKVIPAPSLCLVFFGQVPDTTHTIADMVTAVFRDSDYADGWSEYGVLKRPSLHPSCNRGIVLNDETSGQLTSADIATILRGAVATKQLPPVTLNTHYIVFLGAEHRSCDSPADMEDDFCGYHDTDSGSDDFSFSVLPDFSPANPSCSLRCVGGNVVNASPNQIDWFEATKAMLTQLVINAATNPFSDAWNDPELEENSNNGEVGQLCYDMSGVYQDAVGGHVVQKWYSQQRKGCVTRHLDYVAEAIACGTYDSVTLEPLEWGHHPYDCTDQYDHSRCMYCKGWANGKIVKQCLPRLGAKCNPTFDTAPRQAFCNLEFECGGGYFGPAVLVSLAMILLALFF